jgi:CRP-like cAMP-binding protein
VAQWAGQFSGRTHATRVRDVEEALKLAVVAFREALGEDRAQKAKNIRNLAKRLLSARLRLLRSRIERASEPRMTGQPSAWADGVDALRAKESKTRLDGVNGVLAEFGVREAAGPDSSESSDPQRR